MVRLVRIWREKEREREGLLHSYELWPINLFNLTEKQAASVLDRFIQFLKTLTDRTVFRIIADERRIDAEGEEYVDPEDQLEFERAQQTAEMIAAGKERLVKMKVLIVLRRGRDLSSRKRRFDSSRYFGVCRRNRLGWAGRDSYPEGYVPVVSKRLFGPCRSEYYCR
jgi:hypothetical protein